MVPSSAPAFERLPISPAGFEFFPFGKRFEILRRGRGTCRSRLLPLSLNRDQNWQDIFQQYDFTLYSCGFGTGFESAQLPCLVPAVPG